MHCIMCVRTITRKYYEWIHLGLYGLNIHGTLTLLNISTFICRLSYENTSFIEHS